jgi:regulator of extracellular matrix RemA (YlzA/DUF370 family)
MINMTIHQLNDGFGDILATDSVMLMLAPETLADPVKGVVLYPTGKLFV